MNPLARFHGDRYLRASASLAISQAMRSSWSISNKRIASLIYVVDRIRVSTDVREMPFEDVNMVIGPAHRQLRWRGDLVPA
jgi:hypothetical protein